MSEDLNEKYYELKCPQCGHNTFAEIAVNITSTDPFKRVTFYPGMDFAEPDYMGVVTSGGTIDRIECNKCHHVVAKDHEAFRAWLKANGTLLNPDADPQLPEATKE